MKKVVLAYSGGLDTSVAVAWLREQYDAEVVTLTVDVGGGSLRDGVAERAISAGASRAYVVDGRDRFVAQFVWPALQADAMYQGAYPLATALARPLIAQLLVEVAERERADAVAHGCTGKGNDQVRFDVAVQALDPRLEVVAPMRVGMGLSREQEIDYAIERGIEIPVTNASPYSVDVNLWGRSIETGILEDPWVQPPADVYEWTVDPADAPPPIEIILGFEGGVPVSSTAPRSDRSSSSSGSTRWAARHGVGRIDHVEDRLVGIKSREIYEAPAAAILHAAHRALEGLPCPRSSCASTAGRRRDRPGDLRRPLVQRPPADLREYVAPRSASSTARSACASTTATPSSSAAAATTRCTTGRSRRTTSGTPSITRRAVGFIRIFGLPLQTEARRAAGTAAPEPILPTLQVEVTEPTRTREVVAG